jgi:phenylacetate-CoA ligase
MQTAFTECHAFQGGHHHPEMLIVEFLDENDLPAKHGESGEVTITTLGVEGMPLLRFKTGDICHFYTGECACGRTTIRTGPVIGRRQQMIKYKGTTLYPPAVFDLLNDFPEIVNYQVELTTNEIGTDEMKVWVGAGPDRNGLDKKIQDRFRAKLRVAPRIHFESPEAIQKKIFPQMTRKPVKFVDKRVPGL